MSQIRKKLFKQNDLPENLLASVQNLLYQLEVSVTPVTVKKSLESHYDYPSLQSLKDTLADWNIESMAVQLQEDRLPDISLPSIVQLDQYQGYFVVLTSVDKGKVNYIDPELGIVEVALNDFVKNWTGLVFMVSGDESSGDPDYKKAKRNEFITSLKFPGLLGLFAMLIGSLLFIGSIQHNFFYYSWGVLASVKVTGVIITTLLLVIQLGKESKIAKSVCTVNNASDCQSVLESPAAKIGLFSLSEIGFLYFLGGLLTIVFGVFSNDLKPALGFLYFLNLFALPYTVFSIYYQAFILRKWCPLCVTTQILLWFEFGSGVLFLKDLYSTNNSSSSLVVLLICSFLTPVSIWFLIKPILSKGFNYETLNEDHNKVKRNYTLFQSLYHQQLEVDLEYEQEDLIMGDLEASLTILNVINPTCTMCGIKLKKLEKLLSIHGEYIKVVIRFLVNRESVVAYSVARTITAFYFMGENDLAIKALHGWYEYYIKDKNTLANWKEKFLKDITIPVEMLEKADIEISRHRTWCTSQNIEGTPITFLENRVIPLPYTIEDLKFQLVPFYHMSIGTS